jgi:hypothetical protein
MSAAAYRPSFFVWWYAYCNSQPLDHATPKEPCWRHSFIRSSEDELILETLVPSAHHLHKGSELHHDVGGLAERQDISLSFDKEGDLILGEELNQVVLKRLQCLTEHSVLIQNSSISALVEFRNATERREFVNFAAQLILESHVSFMSVTTPSSPSPLKTHAVANYKESPSVSKFEPKSASSERVSLDAQSHVRYEHSPKHVVKIDLNDLSRSTSHAHQSLSKLTHHLQTAIHKSNSLSDTLVYSSGDDEDVGGWDYWGFLPREQRTNTASNHVVSSATDLQYSPALMLKQQDDLNRASSKKSPSATTNSSHSAQHSVSHGTQTSAVYQTMMSKLLPKDLTYISHSARAKARVPKCQLERNSFTEMTSDWEKTLRFHVPVPNRAVSPHSPRRISSPPKSPRNVQFASSTQFISSQASADTSHEVTQKAHVNCENSKLGHSMSPKRSSPAHHQTNQKSEGSYSEWFEKKRAALEMSGSMTFREKKLNDSNGTSKKSGTFSSSLSDYSKASKKEPPHTPRAESYGSAHVHSKSQQLKSSGSSDQSKHRSTSAPKERKTVLVTPPRVWRIPVSDDHNTEASDFSASKIVKHRSINYGNGNISKIKALKSRSPQAAVGSQQFFQLNQDDFVELISARESTLSPNLNRIRHLEASQSEKDLGGGAPAPAILKQRRFSLFTKKKIAKLEPEISSYLASSEFQSLPVRLQKAFAIGQQTKKPKDLFAQRSFKP